MLAMAPALPKDSGENFLSWLLRHGQTQKAIDRFWAPVLISALNEDLDRVSVRYAALVFRDSFLKSAEAGRMGVPAVPLSQLYGTAAQYIEARGGQVHLRAAIDTVRCDVDGVRLCVGGEELRADYAIIATPFSGVEKLLPDAPELATLRHQLRNFETSPITGIHLWFDREITPLEHAVLLERTIQWMFHKSKILATRRESAQNGSYLELVVSSSKTLVEKPRGEIIELAVRELGGILSGGARGQADEVHCGEGSACDVLAGARRRCLSSVTQQPLAAPLLRGRLDGHRLALHHGRRGAQRLRRRGGAERS